MSVSRKIKQYAGGILLLLLASFIIASVSYMSSLIPETTISPQGLASAKLLFQASGSCSSCGRVYPSVQPNIAGPKNIIYIIDISSMTFSGNPKLVPEWTLYNGTYQSYADWNAAYYNSTIIYTTITIPSNASLINIDLLASPASTSMTGTAIFYLYEANSIYDIFPNPNLTASPRISNKLILSFISWIAGIILILQALHKFGISI